MVIFFIVIANEVLKCFISSRLGIRYCENGSSTELVRLWQIGIVELAFEGTLGGVLVKIYRRLTDRINVGEDRNDKVFSEKDLPHE